MHWMAASIARINDNHLRHSAKQAFTRAVERARADMQAEINAELEAYEDGLLTLNKLGGL